jgi:hypothetical protein
MPAGAKAPGNLWSLFRPDSTGCGKIGWANVMKEEEAGDKALLILPTCGPAKAVPFLQSPFD